VPDPSHPHTAAVIVAAGRGVRAGGDIPKQWQTLGDRRVIDRTLDAFRAAPGIGRIVVVLHSEDMDRLPDEDLMLVAGGDTRSASVRAGLEALEGTGVDRVLIHDAARPCVTPRVIAEVICALDRGPAAAPGLPLTDALWAAANDGTRRVLATRPRDNLYRAQTPQGFHLDAILAAHRAHGAAAADDVEIALAAGLAVEITQGDPDNIKITDPADFARAEAILRGSMTPDIRTGNGFDVHRFGAGDHVILCGVRIPHSRGLKGHSDADVGLHTVTDAIYGALAAGDIGRHFPPSDPQWKGADSRIFLEHAGSLAAERGYTISNLDLTFLCERPKIGPHAAAMTECLADILGLETSRISVKATTTERLGFTGREEGIAAMATVTLVRA
jgi:2-C-methyl-D-erythritol 4-phosphate cytidylyltransferase / 2-C-methyl-D-erythritol 2,4-cyclodiphosphate synthase